MTYPTNKVKFTKYPGGSTIFSICRPRVVRRRATSVRTNGARHLTLLFGKTRHRLGQRLNNLRIFLRTGLCHLIGKGPLKLYRFHSKNFGGRTTRFFRHHLIRGETTLNHYLPFYRERAPFFWYTLGVLQTVRPILGDVGRDEAMCPAVPRVTPVKSPPITVP